MDQTERNRAFGVLALRSLLGVIFFWQGFGKVYDFGVNNVYNNFFVAGMQLNESFIPVWLLKATAYFTSYAELIGGILLLLGLFRFFTYGMLAILLVVVSFGHGIVEPIWDLQHVLFRAALLFPLLLFPTNWDRWNLDVVLYNLSSKGR